MKAWMNKLGGVLLASLLTVMLNGKAYAEERPDTPDTEIIAPAASAEAQAAAPAPVDIPAAAAEAPAPAPAAEAPAAEAPVPETAAAIPGAPASDAPAEVPASVPETLPVGNGTTATVEIPASADDTPAAAAETLLLPENPSADSDDAVNPVQDTPVDAVEPVQMTRGLTAKRAASAPVMLAASAPAEGVALNESDDAASDGSKSGENKPEENDTVNNDSGRKSADGTDTDGQQNIGTSIPYTNGSYILVNHDGTETLNADGDITVLAAGLNKISSISGNGKVRIAGTGILLVDSLEGELELLTFTDIYDSGSVAVFVKQDNGDYLLVNGSTPGILDEEYKVEGVTLVMPENTSLLLCGTGAAETQDHSIVYYHGYDVTSGKINTDDVNAQEAYENVGKLTIAEQAALIVQQGASVVLQNLRSLGQTDTDDYTRYPELIVEDSGKLTVNGSVGDGGYVTVGKESGILSGSGSLTASIITVGDPKAINMVSPDDSEEITGSKLTFSSGKFHIGGSGTVYDLTIHDSTLMPGSKNVTISGLVSTGNNTVVLPNASTLDINSVDGTLRLCQREYYHRRESQGQNTSYKTDYKDEYAQTITGALAGSGTIVFDSGIYKLMNSTALEVSSSGGGLVYDYGNENSASTSPLRMHPSNVTRADANLGKIDLAAAVFNESNDGNGVKRITFKNSLTLSLSALTATSDNGHYKLSTVAFKNELRNTKINDYNEHDAVIEFLHKDGDNTLSTSFYTLYTLPDELIVDDVCLVRVSYTSTGETVAPSEPGTQTGTLFTGSGILGGNGAGSVNFGNMNQGGNTGGNESNNTGNNSGGNENGNTGNNTEDPEPVPLAAYIEDTQEAALVWVEVAPTVSAETDDSAEDADSAEAAAPEDTTYILLALEGEKTLEELGGTAAVSMNYTLPMEYAEKPLYVVFRNEDGSLTAIRASYSEITGLLRFITDRLGEFMVVGFDFDGIEFSEEFYAALAQLKGLENLVYAEYSPV